MVPAPKAASTSSDAIPIAVAARMLGYRAPRTILRHGAAGLLRVRLVAGRRVVSAAEARRARVLTIARAARLAGCSPKTARRRIAAGLIEPTYPAGSTGLAARITFPRLSLDDVARIRRSLGQRAQPTEIPKPGAPRPAQPSQDRPRLVRDLEGRPWLWAWGRWWGLRPADRPGAPR